MRTIPSIAICHGVTHACITSSEEYGYGVFSWHDNEGDAQHNANITGGRCVPVDTIDGHVITPSMAIVVIDRYFEIS